MGEGSERRKGARYEVIWPVTVLTEDGAVEGETRNIAGDGISVFCAEPLRLNATYRMGIVPPGRAMLEFTGKVIWSDLYGIDNDEKAYGMGVCFVEISEHDRHQLQSLIH